MHHNTFINASKLYQFLSIFCVISYVSFPSAYAIKQHHKRTHQSSNISLGKVPLSTQPNNNLTKIARQLNQSDIDFAVQRNDNPLLLIGTSNLSSTKTPKVALFTQLQSATLCGSGGCTTTAYIQKNNQWVKILDSVSGDVEIKKRAHKGMHDLLVSKADTWIWNGKTYVESQRGPALKGLKRSIETHQSENTQ